MWKMNDYVIHISLIAAAKIERLQSCMQVLFRPVNFFFRAGNVSF